MGRPQKVEESRLGRYVEWAELQMLIESLNLCELTLMELQQRHADPEIVYDENTAEIYQLCGQLLARSRAIIEKEKK